MRTGAIAYLGGILLLFQMPELPDVRWCLLLLSPISLLLLAGKLRFLLFFLCGFLWALWHVNYIVTSTITPQFEGRDLTAIGSIISIPRPSDAGSRFHFIIEELYAEGQRLALSGKVSLSWYGKLPQLHSGERWQLTVRLKHPHGFLNPGGFDYEAWLLQQRLRATGYVRNGADNKRLAEPQGLYLLQAKRHDLLKQLNLALQGQAYAGLIIALAMGERQAITDQQWQVLMRTGTNHLVAISGLHIGLVAGLGFVFMRRLWSLIPGLALRWPAPSAAAVAGLILGFIYAALAGFSIPTQRALVMVAVALLAVLLQRHRQPSQVLAVALIVILSIDPLSVLAAGFWLSFAAVAIILFVMNNRLSDRGRWQNWWWRWGRLHVLVTLGLIPSLLVLFQRLPLLSPLANFMAVPWVSLLLVPVVLLGTVLLPLSASLGQGLLHLANLLVSVLWPLLAAIASLDVAQWTQHVPLGWTVLAALVGTLMLLLPRGVPGRWLGLIWLAPVLLLAPARPGQGAVSFTLLDVGQGLAAVVQTRHHVLVYDTGPRYSPGFDAGEAVVVPYLRHQGVNKIDLLMLGHGDNDHIGGAESLRQQIHVRRVSSSVPGKVYWTRAEACQDTQHWQWDGVDFDVLHPGPGRVWQGNNASCVLRVSNGQQSILLSGDIEAFAERRLVATQGTLLASDVLVTPHHGSKTSSTAGFIKAVNPAYALFPVGYRNRYHFPQTEVLQRYRAHGSHVLRSDFHGAIAINLVPGRDIVVIPGRSVARHFWLRHHRFH